MQETRDEDVLIAVELNVRPPNIHVCVKLPVTYPEHREFAAMPRP